MELISEVIKAQVGTEVPPRSEASGEDGFEPDLLLCPDILRGHDRLVRAEYISEGGEVVVELAIVEAKRQVTPQIVEDELVADLGLEEGIPLPVGQFIQQVFEGIEVLVSRFILPATIEEGELILCVDRVG